MKYSVIEQVEIALAAGNRKAGFLSIPAGALTPLAVHCNMAGADIWNTVLAVGGLMYSGITVFNWMFQTFAVEAETSFERYRAAAKALGFVVLMEGSLVHAPQAWLQWTMVVLLGATNAIAQHASMVLAKEKHREDVKALKKGVKKAKVAPIRKVA